MRALISLREFGLTPGRKQVKILPHRFFAIRGRKLKPRKSKWICG
jgi:hypothetical protein